MTGAPAVFVQDVVKRFDGADVLKGVSLQVAPGEKVCIIGPSGSGKTTLLRCMNHLEKVDSGLIYVHDVLVGYRRVRNTLIELREKDVCRQRVEIGMVFQQFNLFPHMTVLENVMEGPIQVRGEAQPVAMERGRALLRRVGLEHKCGAFPRQLSGGQQQRVAIARALAMQPKIMLFDEPTSALDPELTGEVLDVIRSLADDGMTMLIATHEIVFARQVADTIVFMDDGAIVESGSPSEVLDNPRQARTRAFLSKIL